MVNLENHPAFMDYAQRRDFVLRAKEAGHFENLLDRERTILELRYLGEERTSYKAIGKLLDPPRSVERVRQINTDVLSKLHRLNHPDEVGSLGLSPRTYHTLLRSQISTLYQINFMTDDELLSLRNFGPKSLQDLREKLASHQLNRSATIEV